MKSSVGRNNGYRSMLIPHSPYISPLPVSLISTQTMHIIGRQNLCDNFVQQLWGQVIYTPITPNGDPTATMAICENYGNLRRVVGGSLGLQGGRPRNAVTSPKVVIWSPWWPWSPPIFEDVQNLRHRSPTEQIAVTTLYRRLVSAIRTA